MIKDYIALRQEVVIKKILADGTEQDFGTFSSDIVTTVGKNRAASHLANVLPGKTWFTHLALGTNQDAESTEDVALGAEFYRVALDSVFAVGETVFGRSIVQADTIGAGTITVVELGLLDALVGGNLQARQVLETAFTFSGTEKFDLLWGVMIS